MKHYIKNLVLAICGRNPFAEEVEDMKEKLEKAGENVRGLQDQLYTALEKWNEAQQLLFESGRMVGERDKWLAEKDRQMASQQQLVENLRERIRDKDAELEEQGRAFRQSMEPTRQDCDKRIATYAHEIERLQKRQENAKRKIEGMLYEAEHQPMATNVHKRAFMDLLNSILKCLND